MLGFRSKMFGRDRARQNDIIATDRLCSNQTNYQVITRHNADRKLSSYTASNASYPKITSYNVLFKVSMKNIHCGIISIDSG